MTLGAPRLPFTDRIVFLGSRYMKIIKRIRRFSQYLLAGDWAAIGGTIQREWYEFLLWRGKPFVYNRGEVRFVCFPDSQDSRFLRIWSGDVLELNVLRLWLNPGDDFVDAGANLGLYTLTAAHW